MSKVIIQVSHWYDTISPESAEKGDYESTGNDCRDWEYSLDELTDAIRDFARLYHEQCWDYDEAEVNSVLYAADPDTDYRTGKEDYTRLCISVLHSDSIAPELYHEVRNEVQRLLDLELND